MGNEVFCAGTLQLEVFSYICGGWLLTVKGFYRGASAYATRVE